MSQQEKDAEARIKARAAGVVVLYLCTRGCHNSLMWGFDDQLEAARTGESKRRLPLSMAVPDQDRNGVHGQVVLQARHAVRAEWRDYEAALTGKGWDWLIKARKSVALDDLPFIGLEADGPQSNDTQNNAAPGGDAVDSAPLDTNQSQPQHDREVEG